MLSSRDVDAVHTQNAVLDVDLPHGVELQTHRVGSRLTYLDNAQVGETIRFTYSGGSEHGQRTVLVVKVDGKGVEGLTLERDGAYRRYTEYNVGGEIRVVEPFVRGSSTNSIEKRVRFDDAGTALVASLSGEQLAELYNKYVALEGDGASFDANTGEVVVKLPEPKENKIVDAKSHLVVFENTRGKKFYLHIYSHFGDIGFHNYESGADNAKATPDALLTELTRFLS